MYNKLSIELACKIALVTDGQRRDGLRETEKEMIGKKFDSLFSLLFFF